MNTNVIGFCQAFVLLSLTLLAGSMATAAELTSFDLRGASSNRVDVMFIGDGYTETQIDSTYANHVTDVVDHLFQNKAPLTRYRNFFNLHRVDVISNESGADIPTDSVIRDTALDASYSWGGSVDRLLYFNASKANAAVRTAIQATDVDVDMRIGVVNSNRYGGGGGQWAVYAGGNGSAREVATHEIGHSFAGLADEYDYSGGANYTGGELREANVTNDPANGKWDRWVGYDDPDHDIGPIGYYEGARYHTTGIFRPSNNSLMRNLNRPLDAVGREAFIESIYDEVDPLDDWMDAATLLTIGDTVWVDQIDPDVISVQWLVDGRATGRSGSALNIADLDLSAGDYTITARAYDTLINHSGSGNGLDWWRKDAASLTQNVSWQLSVTAVPEPTGIAALLALTAVVIRTRRRPNHSDD